MRFIVRGIPQVLGTIITNILKVVSRTANSARGLAMG